MSNVFKVTGHFIYKSSPTRRLAYSLCSSPTVFRVVYAIIQLYNVQQNCMITIDMSAVRTADNHSYGNHNRSLP